MKKKSTVQQVGKGVGFVGKGFSSLLAMASGDFDKAFEITHGKKPVKVVATQKATCEPKTAQIRYPNYKNNTNMVCPNCGRGINKSVKKCVCGMEFK